MNTWLAVFLGGGLGSVSRFGISRLLVAMELRSAFPWATLASNMLSSALLAFILFRWQHVFFEREVLLAFVAVGFCGGFSTFSTFSLENFMLIRDGSFALAIANVVVSVSVGIGLIYMIARNA